MAVQNLISALVSSVDVVMLGYVSQDALSASSLANQVPFILTMAFYGLSSGASVLVAQYWGKKDGGTIEQIMGLAFRFFMGFSAVFTLAALLFPVQLMQLYTDQPTLIELGSSYLRVVAVSYLFMGFSNFYLSIMRSMERVVFSTAVYILSLSVNIFGNAVFIFGLFGAPKLGLTGVAVATVIARAVEVVVCLIDNALRREIRFRLSRIFGRYRVLMKDFVGIAAPAMVNDILWGVGFSMYSVIFGHLGSDAVAANSVAAVTRNLGTVFCFGFANATGIIVGKAMGQNDLALARLYAKRMSWLTFIAGVVGGGAIVLLCPVLMRTMGRDLTETALSYLQVMILINGYYTIGQGMNTCWIVGCFRAGGDTRFGMILDALAMWVWAVPLGFFCAFVLKFPVRWVYFVLCTDEFSKMPIVIHHYRGGKWLKNITREKAELDG
jgi:putative MATE family efflux protein